MLDSRLLNCQETLNPVRIQSNKLSLNVNWIRRLFLYVEALNPAENERILLPILRAWTHRFSCDESSKFMIQYTYSYSLTHLTIVAIGTVLVRRIHYRYNAARHKLDSTSSHTTKFTQSIQYTYPITG